MVDMEEESPQVLVTGSTGFIGSHLVEILVAAGYEVRAMVRYTARQEVGALRFVEKEIMRSVEIVQGDIKSYDAVARAMEGVELVFHLELKNYGILHLSTNYYFFHHYHLKIDYLLGVFQ